MARTFTLAQIRTAVQALGEYENDANITTAWLNTAISASYTELYDLLVDSGLWYNRSTSTLSPSSGTVSLPADFLCDVALWYEKDSNTRLPLRKLSVRDTWKFKKTSTTGSRSYGYEVVGSNVLLYPPPPSGQTYTLVYVPCASDLTSDAQTVDGVNGWEELIVIDVCIKAGIRQETDVSALMARKSEMLGRIQQMKMNREIASATSLYEECEDNWEWEYGGWLY